MMFTFLCCGFVVVAGFADFTVYGAAMEAGVFGFYVSVTFESIKWAVPSGQ